MSDSKNTEKVICIESVAFYMLIEEVVERLQGKNQSAQNDKWISDAEAMQKLRITSRTTLQKLRDEGAIRYSQPTRKLILYDRDSINEYLETHAKETF